MRPRHVRKTTQARNALPISSETGGSASRHIGAERIFDTLAVPSIGGQVVDAALRATELAESTGIPFEEALGLVEIENTQQPNKD